VYLSPRSFSVNATFLSYDKWLFSVSVSERLFQNLTPSWESRAKQKPANFWEIRVWLRVDGGEQRISWLLANFLSTSGQVSQARQESSFGTRSMKRKWIWALWHGGYFQFLLQSVLPKIKSQTRDCLLVSDLIAGFSLDERYVLPFRRILQITFASNQHYINPRSSYSTSSISTKANPNSNQVPPSQWPLNTLPYSLNLVFSSLHSFRLPNLIPTIRRILWNLWRNSRAHAFRAIGGDNTSVCFLCFLAVLLLLHAAESERNAHLRLWGRWS